MSTSERFHVLSAELLHETNTFCRLPTTLDCFAERCLLLDDTALAARAHLNTELGGFAEAAQAHGWRLTHTISAHAQPGGRVTRDAFEALVAPIIRAADRLATAGELTGVLLGLHGAMVTDDSDDGEGELLTRLRAVVGPHLPIAITLDPHANVTRRMCELADIMVSFKTYPHTDMRATARQAADLLQRAMRREIRPRCLRVTRPMLEEVNGGRTDAGPMAERIAQARAAELLPDLFAVSVNGGFPNADIAEVGPSVVVCAQGDLAAATRLAHSLADDMWERRHDRINQFLTVEQAAAHCHHHALRHVPGRGPIVVADYADNPGAGAYGDGTALLSALLDVEIEGGCFGAIVDPEAVQTLQQHAVGEQVSLTLGGRTDPRFGGGPLAVTGRLRLLSDGNYVGCGAMIGGLERSWGPMAVLEVAGWQVLVVTVRAQVVDLQQFRAFGIDPAAMRVVAVKSMQHFRADFEPIADKVIVCDSGALATLDYAQLPFTNRPRPLFPFETDIDINTWLRANEQGLFLPATR